MNVITCVIESWPVLALSPPALYGSVYLALRSRGKLRVNRDGWLAESVQLGSRIWLTAFQLFAVFQTLLRLESALRRCFFRNRRPDDQAVSEVVVEMVPMA